MRVLLLEDERELRQGLAERLRDQGHVVDEAADGPEGWYIGHEYPIDVAVVDLGLPGVEGAEVIRRWRNAGRRFPVLVLTARGRWQEKVSVLELGADDYLTKPVQPEELMARLRALVRRSHGWSSDTLAVGPYRMETAAQRFWMHDQVVDLTAFEYRVLEQLMLNAGEVVSRTQLTEHLYADDADRDSNVLEVLIGRLRRKLDPDKQRNPITTLRGRGYRFELTAVRADASDDEKPAEGPTGVLGPVE